MTNMEPSEQAVMVISPQFLAPYPVDLTIKGKTWTVPRNDFDVVDVNGTPILKIKCKLFGPHDRRRLLDPSGNVLATFQQKLWSMHSRWNCFRGDSTDEKDLLFTIKRQRNFQLRTRLDVFLAANREQQVPDFHIRSSYTNSNCTIYLAESDNILAQMSYGRTLLDEKFALSIYPNVDYAFISLLVVIFEDITRDRN